MDLDPTLTEGVGDLFSGEGLLPGEEAGERLDEDDPAAKGRPGLGQLDADDAAAEDQQAVGDLLDRGRLPVGPRLGLSEAGNRGHRGGASGRDHNRPAGLVGRFADGDPTRAGLRRLEPAEAADQGDPEVFDPRELDGVVEVVDDVVAALERDRRVETPADRLGRAGDAEDLAEELGRPEEGLRGHAGVEGALAADELSLDDRDRQAGLRQAAGADLAGRAGTEHDDVEIAHAGRIWDSYSVTSTPRQKAK